MKTIASLAALALLAAACVPPAPRTAPSIYIESPTLLYGPDLPLDARIVVEDAWTALRQGNAPRALRALEKLGPGSPFYDAGQGYVSLLAGDLTAAEGWLARAVEQHPDVLAGHLGLAQVYLKAGRDEEAYEEIREILKRAPDNAWAAGEADGLREGLAERYLGEAKAQATAGHAAAAKEAYLKVLDIKPMLQDANLALARLYLKDKDYQSALIHLKTASANAPKDASIQRDYAEALYQAGQPSRSLDAYERLLELQPSDKAAKERIEAIKARLGIVDIPSQYGAIPGLPAVTKEDAAALIGVKFRDVLDETPKPPVMIDIATSWAQRFIVKVAGLGLMEVYANHAFEPRRTLTRAEGAEILLRLVDYLRKKGVRMAPPIALDRIKISDVPPEHPYRNPIVRIVAYQIMGLGPERTFRPDAPLSGQDAAKALDVLLGLAR